MKSHKLFGLLLLVVAILFVCSNLYAKEAKPWYYKYSRSSAKGDFVKKDITVPKKIKKPSLRTDMHPTIDKGILSYPGFNGHVN
jgi:hypothetical protein